MKGLRQARRGFALIVTLWVLVGASALALAAARGAHEAIGAAQNRRSLARATWLAYGCAEQIVGAMESALWMEGSTPSSVHAVWQALDSAVAGEVGSRKAGCDVNVTPSGLALDANLTTEAELILAFTTQGRDPAGASSLVDALLDWRDPDDSPRHGGAEADWYSANHRLTPRNGAFGAREEIYAVRGFEEDSGAAAVLDVGPGRVFWPRASLSVIAGLPGITAEAVSVFATHRNQLTELSLLGTYPELSAPARDALSRAIPALVERSTATPEFWTIRSRAGSGSPRIEIELEWRVTRADAAITIIRRTARP